MKILTYYICGMIGLMMMMQSCADGFLSMNPDMKKRVPKTVADLQGLMDNTAGMNRSSHVLGMIGSDEFYITDGAFAAFPEGLHYNYQKRAYLWDPFIFEGGEAVLLDWNVAYMRILWANTALDGLKSIEIPPSEREQADMVAGMAHFHRAWNFYCLAQLVTKPFSSAAKTDLGLPLRLEADVTVNVGRSSLADTYDQIIDDLQTALALLPPVPLVNFRPGKSAVYALLARVYMQLEDYALAYDYANKCLAIQNNLIDFNGLDLTQPLTFRPYGEGNPEIIFMATCAADPSSVRMLIQQIVCVDTAILAKYKETDLRKSAFFTERGDGTYLFKGSYDGTNIFTYFTGLSVSEMLLVRAECAARLDNRQVATDDLNSLRMNRYTQDDFVELYSDNTQQVLDWIIEERQKELIFRGTRWEDLRRLNKETRYQMELVRTLAGEEYSLPPNDARYVWPIPLEAIQMGGYEQNAR